MLLIDLGVFASSILLCYGVEPSERL
jgi:hypothetical protein